MQEKNGETPAKLFKLFTHGLRRPFTITNKKTN